MLDSSKQSTAPEIARRVPQGAGGDRRHSAGVAPSSGVPDPELAERPRRRRFSAEYKLGVLRAAEACTRKGEIGRHAAPRCERTSVMSRGGGVSTDVIDRVGSDIRDSAVGHW